MSRTHTKSVNMVKKDGLTTILYSAGPAAAIRQMELCVCQGGKKYTVHAINTHTLHFEYIQETG